MRREPEITIKHRTHHLQRIARSAEVVCDDQSHSANERRSEAPNALMGKALQHYPKSDRDPADEYRRRIKIRHWWAALQVHTHCQAHRVDSKGQE